MGIIYKGEGESLKIRIENDFFLLRELEELPPQLGIELCLWMAKQFKGMPGAAAEAILLPRLFLKKDLGPQITFYGGTFRSWHKGHSSCLSLCPEENILVVPDNNPWRPLRSTHTIWNRYISLCRLLRDTPHSVYPGFMALQHSTPMAHWLPQSCYSRRNLIVGEDNFLAFDRWEDYPLLIQSLQTLYVVPRGGNEKACLSMKEHLQHICQGLNIVLLPRHPYEDLSASKFTQAPAEQD